jgi:methanogenic corrinoid protein MtbC1
VVVNDISPFLQHDIPAGLVETFADLVLSPDGSDCAQLVEQLLDDGVSPETVMLELIGPAARLMGDMWSGDQANFLEVTLGLSRLQHLMRQFRLPVMHAVADRGAALLVPVPGEQHVLGLRMVEEFLIRDGWRVRCTPVSGMEQLRQAVSSEHYDFVGFSISGERLLPVLRSAIREVRAHARNRQIRVMAGGVVLGGGDPLVPGLGADVVVRDASDAVQQARRWHALAGVT